MLSSQAWLVSLRIVHHAVVVPCPANDSPRLANQAGVVDGEGHRTGQVVEGPVGVTGSRLGGCHVVEGDGGAVEVHALLKRTDGLADAQLPVDGVTVVEILGEVQDRPGHPDGCGAHRPNQLEAVETACAAQRHVCLPVGESTSAEVDRHPVEGQGLTLVDGDRPGEFKGKLLHLPGHGLDTALLLRIILVVDGLPLIPLHDVLLSAFDLDYDVLFSEFNDLPDRSVDPAAAAVVLGEHHLRTGLQGQRLLSDVGVDLGFPAVDSLV